MLNLILVSPIASVLGPAGCFATLVSIWVSPSKEANNKDSTSILCGPCFALAGVFLGACMPLCPWFPFPIPLVSLFIVAHWTKFFQSFEAIFFRFFFPPVNLPFWHWHLVLLLVSQSLFSTLCTWYQNITNDPLESLSSGSPFPPCHPALLRGLLLGNVSLAPCRYAKGKHAPNQKRHTFSVGRYLRFHWFTSIRHLSSW